MREREPEQQEEDRDAGREIGPHAGDPPRVHNRDEPRPRSGGPGRAGLARLVPLTEFRGMRVGERHPHGFVAELPVFARSHEHLPGGGIG